MDRYLWVNDKLIRSSDAKVDLLSPTAQFGLNVFEGVRAYLGNYGELNIFRLDEHIIRLEESCRLVEIDFPFEKQWIFDAIREVVAANDYRSDLALRITVYIDGEGSWSVVGKSPSIFIAPIPKSRNTYGENYNKSACVSRWRRICDLTLPPRVKLGANYINGRYATLQANSDGYDFAIFLDHIGNIAEGAGSCVFLVKDGVLKTPPLSSSILDSITRSTIIEIANDNSIKCEVGNINSTDLYLADEIFMCGSAVEITPITKIDRFSVNNGEVGRVSEFLLAKYHEIVSGNVPKYAKWLKRI